MKKRVIYLVDGFNLYHSIKRQQPQCRWLDLNKLANCFIAPSKEELETVIYFSALATWLPSKAVKHRIYIKALQEFGVEVILGQFKAKQKRCQAKCKLQYWSHEEKETDVNIALYLLKLAVEDKFDKAVIVSADSDLIPAMKMVKSMYPAKEVGVCVPIGGKANELIKTADCHYKIKGHHVKQALLPKRMTLKDGMSIYSPKGWA